MIKLSLEKPETIGIVSPDILPTIRDELGHGEYRATWLREQGLYRADARVLEALSPLTAELIEAVGYTPEEIKYTIDTNPIEPGSRQRRQDGWHEDAGVAKSIVVSDRMPTDFLTFSGGWPSKLCGEFLLRAIKNRGTLNDLISEEDDKLPWYLDIYSPPTNRFVEVANRIHRSPINITEGVIERTWIGAEIR